MSQERLSPESATGKVLGPTTPWTERQVPGIQVADEQQTFKSTFTEPTIECPECHALVTRTAMSFNAYVCPQCDEHLRMKARDRLTWFFDQVNSELGQEFSAKDPLKFVDSRPYPERMREAQDKTGESEALVVMQGSLKGLDLVACAFEFDFMGGSMGTVVGDRFVQAAEKAEPAHPLDAFAQGFRLLRGNFKVHGGHFQQVLPQIGVALLLVKLGGILHHVHAEPGVAIPHFGHIGAPEAKFHFAVFAAAHIDAGKAVARLGVVVQTEFVFHDGFIP